MNSYWREQNQPEIKSRKIENNTTWNQSNELLWCLMNVENKLTYGMSDELLWTKPESAFFINYCRTRQSMIIKTAGKMKNNMHLNTE